VIKDMPKKVSSKKKPLETLPCPVCGRMPELKKFNVSEKGIHYLYVCIDVTILSSHEIWGQAWETVELAACRWNDAIKTLEKRRQKNIKDRETWG
jgi:hypothetical protein